MTKEQTELKDMKLISATDVTKICTLSRTNLFEQEAAGTFPARVILSKSRFAFPEKEVSIWLAEKYRLREEFENKHDRADYLELPYGVCTTPNGTEVAFNREYEALWVRSPDGSCERTERCHILELQGDYKGSTEEWFIKSDIKSPRVKQEYWARSERILLDFVTGQSIRKYVVD